MYPKNFSTEYTIFYGVWRKNNQESTDGRAGINNGGKFIRNPESGMVVLLTPNGSALNPEIPNGLS